MGYVVKVAVPDEVAEKQFQVIRAVRENPKKGLHTKSMTQATVMMAESTLDFYFARPLALMKTKSLIKTMVMRGLKTGVALISKGAKMAYGAMGEKELMQWCAYMESLISEDA